MLFNKTHIYTVHIPPHFDVAKDEAVFIREGFNFFAFLFTFLWALYHRMWVMAPALFLVTLAAKWGADYGYFSMVTLTLINLAIQFISGLEGNNWRRDTLSRRGYIFADIVTSDTEIRARQRFYDRFLNLYEEQPAPRSI